MGGMRGGTRHFVIYSARGLCLLRADSTLAVIQRFIVEEHQCLELRPDGTVVDMDARRPITYAHALEFVEACEKTGWAAEQYGSWKIWEVPDWVWTAALVPEFGVLEDMEMVAKRVAECRPFLRRDYPRSRAPGFVWYVRQGALVTFYRRRGPWRIQVLARYLADFEREKAGGPYISRWEGSYDDILNEMVVTYLPNEKPSWAT